MIATNGRGIREKVKPDAEISVVGLTKAFGRQTVLEDISCDGPNIPIYLFHRKYESLRTNVVFTDEVDLDGFVIRLAQRCGKCVHRGNRCGAHADVGRPLHRAASPSGRWHHRAILSFVVDSMQASCTEVTACTCMSRQVRACTRMDSYANYSLWGSVDRRLVCQSIWRDKMAHW